MLFGRVTPEAPLFESKPSDQSAEIVKTDVRIGPSALNPCQKIPLSCHFMKLSGWRALCSSNPTTAYCCRPNAALNGSA